MLNFEINRNNYSVKNYLIMPAAAAEQVLKDPIVGIPEHMVHADQASFYVDNVDIEDDKRTAFIAGKMHFSGKEDLVQAAFEISMPGMIERGFARLLGKSDELMARVQYSEYNVTT